MLIDKIFEEFKALLPDNEAYEGYCEDVVLKGSPDAVLRPNDKFELQRIIKLCSQHRIPFTACGSQTSVTGASVAHRGILISMEKFKGVEKPLDIGNGTACVKVQRVYYWRFSARDGSLWLALSRTRLVGRKFN